MDKREGHEKPVIDLNSLKDLVKYVNDNPGTMVSGTIELAEERKDDRRKV